MQSLWDRVQQESLCSSDGRRVGEAIKQLFFWQVHRKAATGEIVTAEALGGACALSSFLIMSK